MKIFLLILLSYCTVAQETKQLTRIIPWNSVIVDEACDGCLNGYLTCGIDMPCSSNLGYLSDQSNPRRTILRFWTTCDFSCRNDRNVTLYTWSNSQCNSSLNLFREDTNNLTIRVDMILPFNWNGNKYSAKFECESNVAKTHRPFALLIVILIIGFIVVL